MTSGSHGHGVVELQQHLGQLGYALRPDGSYGPATAAAVRSFQQAHDLKIDGVAGVATLKALAEQTQALAGASRCGQARLPGRLDDPSHPDHALFLDARALVHDLDRQHGRSLDQRSDNLASSLVVAARGAGLQRLDQVALSHDASVLWGAQRPAGLGDSRVDAPCRVNTLQGLNTPMEQSGSQWSQAMRQFEQAQQETLTQAMPQAALEPAMSTSQVR
jgi:peptidoglycan hydrolase-like protein with peptidoglycan-binding domain